MSGRLKLRRGVVVGEEPLTVEIDGERRTAIRLLLEDRAHRRVEPVADEALEAFITG